MEKRKRRPKVTEQMAGTGVTFTSVSDRLPSLATTEAKTRERMLTEEAKRKLVTE